GGDRGLRAAAARWRSRAKGARMKSLILLTATPFLAALLALFSVFKLLRAHDEPGGGFVGGLLLAGCAALYLLSYSPAETRRLLRVRPRALTAAGLLVAAASAIAGPV